MLGILLLQSPASATNIINTIPCKIHGKIHYCDIIKN